MDLCLLHIDRDDIGIPMNTVREVLIRPGINRLPLSPDFLIGVTGFRGMCLPVIELTRLPHPDSSPMNPIKRIRDRVVVCQQNKGAVGLLVDLVNRQNTANPTPPTASSELLIETLENPDPTSPPLRFLHLTRLSEIIHDLMKPNLAHLL